MVDKSRLEAEHQRIFVGLNQSLLLVSSQRAQQSSSGCCGVEANVADVFCHRARFVSRFSGYKLISCVGIAHRP